MRREPITPEIRLQILERDGYKCYYCKHPLTLKIAHIDHVLPVRRGGKTEIENLVAACPSCNISKGSRLPEEWEGIVLYLQDGNFEEKLSAWVADEGKQEQERKEKLRAARELIRAEREKLRQEKLGQMQRRQLAQNHIEPDTSESETIDFFDPPFEEFSDSDVDEILSCRIMKLTRKLAHV